MGTNPLLWIVNNWRLKLLALVLTLGLLAGVAFTNNPPEVTTVPVRVLYQDLPSNLVLIDPPLTVDVQVIGLEDAISQYRAAPAGVTVDLAQARVGSQVYEAHPRVGVSGVTPQTSSIPIHLTVQELRTVTLPIEVRTPKKASGIAIVPQRTLATCGNATQPCQVTVTGPASVVQGLKAYVQYDLPLRAATTLTSPDQRVLFERDGRPVDLRSIRSIPPPSWTPEVATVEITTVGGVGTRTVGLTVKPIGTQACGYEITGVAIQPSPFVTLSGPPGELAGLGNAIALLPVDIQGLTSSQTYVRTVPTGSPEVAANPSTVTVTVTVVPAFSCTAPNPTSTPAATVPTPTPKPSPSPTPT
jgi:YbbR domain-containing protein